MTLLTEFYKDAQKWLDGKHPPAYTFSQGWGLCLSLEQWTRVNGCFGKLNALAEEQRQAFEAAGLHPVIPFEPHVHIHLADAEAGELDQNRFRRLWITHMAAGGRPEDYPYDAKDIKMLF